MRYSTKGWIVVGLVVGVIEVLAPADDMLSHGVDRARQHPLGDVVVTAAIGITASHLLRLLDPRIDPFTLAFSWKHRGRQ